MLGFAKVARFARLLVVSLLVGKAMATDNYTVALPESATIVTNWDELHAQGPLYPYSMLMKKYGGYVIEVDNVIVVATSDNMTEEVDATMASLPLEDGEDGAVDDTTSNGAGASTLGAGADTHLVKRACSRPRCFNSAICLTYTDCHVCTQNGLHRVRGNCI